MEHIRKQLEAEKKRQSNDVPRFKRHKKVADVAEDEDEFLPDSNFRKSNGSGLTPDTIRLLRQLGDNVNNSIPDEGDEFMQEYYHTKIIFASRTHSQLSQFVKQLRLPVFDPVVSSSESVKHVPFSSRKQLCIHPKVSKLSNVEQVNDACLDMQKEISKKCEFMLTKDPADKIRSSEFQEKVLSEIHDIEDLVNLGRESNVCPYYESRKTASMAEIVTMPYQLLLQRSSRKALGVDLKDAIIVIDEAHNILDTISSMSSTSVSLADVSPSLQGLQIYYDKFKNRLKGINKVYVAKLIKLVSALQDFLKSASQLPAKKTFPGTKVSQASILGTAGDLVNMHELEAYLQESKLVFKVESYLDSREQSGVKQSLFKIVSFLMEMSNPSADGQTYYGRRPGSNEVTIEYLLLDPSEKFRDLVDEARCIVLAGGTMEPVEDYKNFLFPYVPEQDVRVFSCGHVIPDTNLCVSTLESGPSKKEFHFTFDKRDSSDMIDELGDSIYNLCGTIPHGVVVFVPSYQYLDKLIARWKTTQNGVSLWDKLSQRKSIFMEPKKASETEQVLSKFAERISQGSGALLLSVVGAKLSEGINFSDNMARGVILVGLPFPNLLSTEMVAKGEFVKTETINRGGTPEMGKKAQRDFYLNVCMRAVNQSIGRAIRHANDYAAIILVDKRYGNDSQVREKMSGWIRDRLPTKSDWQSAYSSTTEFFRQKHDK